MVQVKVGTYTGNGSDDRGITGVGFQPDCVWVKGGANEWVVRTSTMSGDLTKQMATAAALAANMIQSLDSDGFTVGSDARVNANATAYYYVALRDDGNSDFKVGTYAGNSTDNTNITGVGFTPQAVVYLPPGAVLPGWNLSGTNNTQRSDNTFANLIKAFVADGFTVGSGSNNTTGVTYHYLAFKDVASVCKITTYTGNGSDGRNLTGVGFQPDFGLIQRRTVASVGVVRFKDNSGDSSAPITASAFTTNIIQGFISDGFELGTAANVNTNASVYDYLALKETAVAEAAAGATAGASTVSGTLTATVPVAATTAGASTAAGALSATVPVAASAAGVATVAGTATATVPVAASTAGTSTVGGSLTEEAAAEEAAAGASAGTSTVSGTLSAAVPVTASAAGSSTVSGTLSAAVAVAAAVAGQSAATGAIVVAGALAGSSAGVGTVAGALAASVALAAVTAGQSALTGTMTGGEDVLPAIRASASDSAYGGAVASSAALVGAVASDSEG